MKYESPPGESRTPDLPVSASAFQVSFQALFSAFNPP